MNVLLQMIDKKLMKNNRFTFFMSNDADKGKSGIWFDDVPQSLYQVILSSRLLSCIKLFVCRVNLKSTRLFPRTTGVSSYWTSRCTHTTRTPSFKYPCHNGFTQLVGLEAQRWTGRWQVYWSLSKWMQRGNRQWHLTTHSSYYYGESC